MLITPSNEIQYAYKHDHGRFQILYCDPPWPYNNRLTGEGRTKFGEGVHAHYNTMTVQDIADLGPLIADICEPTAVLMMWVTAPHLTSAFQVAEAWGFDYATKAFCWVKISKDGRPRQLPGQYTASNTEDCLLFTRRPNKQAPRLLPTGQRMTPQVVWEQEHPDGLPEIVATTLREHSRKPDEVRERIKQMYPTEKKIELFCRYPDPEFASLGNEIDGLDIRDALVLAAGGYYDLAKPEEELVG